MFTESLYQELCRSVLMVGWQECLKAANRNIQVRELIQPDPYELFYCLSATVVLCMTTQHVYRIKKYNLTLNWLEKTRVLCLNP